MFLSRFQEKTTVVCGHLVAAMELHAGAERDRDFQTVLGDLRQIRGQERRELVGLVESGRS